MRLPHGANRAPWWLGGEMLVLAAAMVASVLLAGCSSETKQEGSSSKSPESGKAPAQDPLTTLWRPQPKPVKLTDPLELDQGRLQLPTPEGWELRRVPDYLLVCHRGNYPRIYVAAADDAAFTNITPANVVQYAQSAAKRLGDKKLAVPVRPVQVGNFVGVSYGWEATAKGKRLMRFFLVTTRGQRRYTIELRCLEATYDAYRDTALAVAAAARFGPAKEEKHSADKADTKANTAGKAAPAKESSPAPSSKGKEE